MGLRALIGTLGLNITGWQHGWQKAETTAKKASAGIASFTKGQLGAMFGAAAMGAAIKNTVEYAGHIRDMSDALGISTDTLQQLDFAATQSGSSLDQFTGAMLKLGKAQQEAVNDPKGDAAKAFEKLGVSAQQLKGMRVEDLFTKVGKAFESAVSPQALLTAGLAVMGKSATSVFPAMVAGLTESMEAAKGLGQVMSEDVIDSLDDMGDKVDELKGLFRTELGGAVVWILEKIRATVTGISRVAQMMGAMSVRQVGWDEALEQVASNEMEKESVRSSAKAARDKTRAAARAFSAAVEDTDVKTKKATKSPAGIGASTSTGWQNIGAFAFTNPLLGEQKQSNRYLADIRRNTAKKSEGAVFSSFDDLLG